MYSQIKIRISFITLANRNSIRLAIHSLRPLSRRKTPWHSFRYRPQTQIRFKSNRTPVQKTVVLFSKNHHPQRMRNSLIPMTN